MKRLPVLPPWIWLRRFRQRCGYGVHSPFAFDFITGVIYERGMFYAFKELDALLPWHVRTFNLRPRRLLRLLFRLANYSEARKAAFLGSDPLALAFMKAAIPQAEWSTEYTEPTDLVYLSQPLAEGSLLPQAKMIIVDDLLHNKATFEALKKDEHTTLSFDLYDIGIIMQGLKLNIAHYIVNF